MPNDDQQDNSNRNPGRGRTGFPFGRWLIRGFLVIVILGAMASAAVLIPRVMSTEETDFRLTHTIKRGDLIVTVTEQGTLESFDNTEIKCKVRGSSTVTWVIESGTVVKPGEELVLLDTKRIEEEVSLGRTNVFEATATIEETRADLAAAKISIEAYLEGRFRSRLKSRETGLAIAESNLRSAQKMFDHSKLLFKRGYVTELELEGNAFTVTQAELELKVAETEIDVLKRFTKEMELESMNGRLTYTTIKLKADEAGLAMDEARRDRAMEELDHCVVKADKGGLVIYPTAEAWKNQPDITEGARVTKDQVLLIMPELSKMQIKVGIHESIIDRVKLGMVAKIRLPEMELKATVSEVAAITKPAGWWTGNVVKYDTIIELPSMEDLLLEEIQRLGEEIPEAERALLRQTLEIGQPERTDDQRKLVDDAQAKFLPDYKTPKPGMSAEVEVIINHLVDVLKIPVAAVVETERGRFCWVKTGEKIEKRRLKLGDSNDVFIEVKDGLREGEQVVLNPLAMIKEAQDEAQSTVDSADASGADSAKPEPGQNSQ